MHFKLLQMIPKLSLKNTNHILKEYPGLGVAQAVKGLPRKHEGLRSVLQHPWKKWVVMVFIL